MLTCQSGPSPRQTYTTHCIGLSNHMWFSTSTRTDKILFMNTQNNESCTSSDRTTQPFSNHLWSLCKSSAKVNDQFCFHWKCHHQPDFPRLRNQSNPTMLSCVSATLKWAQWGWKSCVSCSATGMEPALSARARWDWSRLQKTPKPKVLQIIFCIVLQCSKCKPNILSSLTHLLCFQIERFVRMGIPPSLRGRVWKCLLTIDSLRETSDFNYEVKYSETCTGKNALFQSSPSNVIYCGAHLQNY